jgi:hypothetical protein
MLYATDWWTHTPLSHNGEKRKGTDSERDSLLPNAKPNEDVRGLSSAAERKANDLFDGFVSAYRAGKAVNIQECISQCPAPERERLRDALDGFVLLYEDYYAAQVSEESVHSALDRIQQLRRRKRILAEATARAARLSWDKVVTQPLQQLERILYPSDSMDNVQSTTILNRETFGESSFLSSSLDALQKRAAEQFARNEAEKLLLRAGAPAAPIPLEAIAEQLCLLVREAPLKSAEGCLVTDGATGGILLHTVNTDDGPDRRRTRFTLAHEIGHFILHRKSQGHFSDRESRIDAPTTSRSEFEASTFASHLLMPSTLLPREFGRELPTFAMADAVSEAFGVSLLAVLRRLVRDSHHRTIFVHIEGERVTWRDSSPEVAGPRGIAAAVPIGSAARALFRAESTDTATRDLPADTWFDRGRILAEGTLIREESRRFASGRIYTLLTVLEGSSR